MYITRRHYPMALESAIKLQKFIHSREGFRRRIKHGPIALISKLPVTLVATTTKKDILSNAEEVKARRLHNRNIPIANRFDLIRVLTQATHPYRKYYSIQILFITRCLTSNDSTTKNLAKA